MNPRGLHVNVQGHRRMPHVVARHVITMEVPAILAAAARRENLRKWSLLALTVAGVLALCLIPRLSRAALVVGAQAAVLLLCTWAGIRLGMELDGGGRRR